MSEALLAEKLAQLVHPRVGVVRWMVEGNLQPDEPPIHIFLCEFTNPLKMRPQRISDQQWQAGSIEESRQRLDMRAGAQNPVGRKHSTGAGGDRVTALWATLGEACERYAMHLDSGFDAISAREAELDGPVVSPERFILFSDDQYDDVVFPFARYDRSRPLQWRKALNLDTGDEHHVPAQFVSGPLEKNEYQVLDSLYSTGCAAGSTPAHAVNSALREVIERDAFMFYWLTRSTPRKIDLAAAAPLMPEWVRPMLGWQGVDVFALLLDADHGIPTICCLLLPKYGAGVAIGASTHLDWRQALEKALVESFHTLNWVIDMDRWNLAAPDASELRSFSDHVAYYRDPARRAKLDFLLRGPATAPAAPEGLPEPDDHKGQNKEMVRRLVARGLDAFAVNITPADLQSAGIHVARALVPGMHPLHAGVGTEHFDRRRLEGVAGSLGLEVPAALNGDPHPFP
jgi:ribosomal protein S12 methylthiotransferase accessory factor